LAAHGVGIGSFVYIRRIFERLIVGRFKEAKDAEGWTDEQFAKLRMAERIELLKDHLPPFLVANKKLYSIVSRGIHSLGENECLQFFEVLRASCAIILDEDKRKKEELAMKNNLEKAIQKYAGGAKIPEEKDLTNRRIPAAFMALFTTDANWEKNP
jgi:hypothetical protein